MRVRRTRRGGPRDRRGRGRGRRHLRPVAVAERVRPALARLDRSAEPRAAAVPAGTVVSASGNTITITDFQGFQRTIHTTSATTYADGLTATPAAGTRIYAAGAVDTDKTSLKATRFGKLPDKAEGHGFPGRGFRAPSATPRPRRRQGRPPGHPGSRQPDPVPDRLTSAEAIRSGCPGRTRAAALPRRLHPAVEAPLPYARCGRMTRSFTRGRETPGAGPGPPPAVVRGRPLPARGRGAAAGGVRRDARHIVGRADGGEHARRPVPGSAAGRAWRRVAVRHHVHGPAGRRLGRRRREPARRHRHRVGHPGPTLLHHPRLLDRRTPTEWTSRPGGPARRTCSAARAASSCRPPARARSCSALIGGGRHAGARTPARRSSLDSGHVVAYDAGVQSRLRRAVEGRSVQSAEVGRGVSSSTSPARAG